MMQTWAGDPKSPLMIAVLHSPLSPPPFLLAFVCLVQLRLSVLALEEKLAAVRAEAASQSLGGKAQGPPLSKDAGKAEALEEAVPGRQGQGPVEEPGKAPRQKDAAAAAAGVIKGLPPPPVSSAAPPPDAAAAAASATVLQPHPPAPPAAAAEGAWTAAAEAPKETTARNNGPLAASSSSSSGGSKRDGSRDLGVMKQELIELDKRSRALAAAAESGDPKVLLNTPPPPFPSLLVMSKTSRDDHISKRERLRFLSLCLLRPIHSMYLAV